MQLASAHGGHLIKSTGDGVLARFDAPRDGLRFATLLQDRLASIGLTIRVGMHMGEIEVLANGDILGAAVNLAGANSTSHAARHDPGFLHGARRAARERSSLRRSR